MTLKSMLKGAALALALAGPATLAHAETIKIGQTFPYSGSVSALGEVGTAFQAYFKKVNADGGINGNTIEVISYDDAYSPPKTVEATRRLIERDRVLFIAGSLGSANNLAIRQYLNTKKVPHIFLATPTPTFNDPAGYPWTMGWQPSSFVEGKVLGEFIARNHADKKIGVLMQNDDYGKPYIAGITEGLGDVADNIVAHVTYEVSDPTVDAQIINLQSSGAEVLFDISTPKFAAQAIRKAHDLSWAPIHLLTTPAASVNSVLRPAGLEASQGLYTALYLKEPSDPRWDDDQGMKDFLEFMQTYMPGVDQNSVFSVIGYSLAMSTAHVIEAAGDDLSRENILKLASSLEGVELPMLLPGITMNTSADDYAVLDSMRLGQFKGEAWELIDDDAN